MMADQHLRRAQYEIKRKCAAEEARMRGATPYAQPLVEQAMKHEPLVGKPEIPQHVRQKWQRLLDLMVEIGGVAGGMILKLRPFEGEVLARSSGAANPYQRGETIQTQSSPWYAAFLKQQAQHFSSYAYRGDKTGHTHSGSRGMRSFVGYPVRWSDGESFGILCLYEHDTQQIPASLHKLASEFTGVIEDNLHLLSYMHDCEQIREKLRQSVARTDALALLDTLGSKSDLSDINQLMHQLDYIAHHDSLTGLPNRLLFNARLRHAIQHARREFRKVAVLMLDLDGFKQVNDSFGHALGDTLLQQVATRLSGQLREEDTVARLGGDEFAVIVGAIDDCHDVEQITRKIQDCFTDPFNIEGHKVRLSASIGLSMFPDHGEAVDALVRNADLSMYQTKGGLQQMMVCAAVS